jgi:hypothetical protein
LERPSDEDETRNLVRGKMPSMKITTGIVVDGKVVVEGESLAEGSTVTVVLRDNEEAFELTPAEEDELLDSIAQIEGGEFVSGEQLTGPSHCEMLPARIRDAPKLAVP